MGSRRYIIPVDVTPEGKYFENVEGDWRTEATSADDPVVSRQKIRGYSKQKGQGHRGPHRSLVKYSWKRVAQSMSREGRRKRRKNED